MAGYFIDENDLDEKTSMTSLAPISMENSMMVMFMVPKKFNIEPNPNHNESQVEFRQELAKSVGDINFGGWLNDETFA